MALTRQADVHRRCYRCFRPRSLCFCSAIPRIDNRTDVLILQHVGERFHPFNTARIVREALSRCRLIVDHNRRFDRRRLPIRAGAGLLFPDANAPSLTELSIAERPEQLVIIDGTWHQAKTIVRDAAQLQDLPAYRLAPAAPGQYRIRREPDAHSLSTLEATVAALQALEPDTAGLAQLLSAFNEMVETQLTRAGGLVQWRKKTKGRSRPRHLPRALLQNADRLVVAYGEATPGHSEQRQAAPTPVSWVARRLGTAERFSCRLRPERPLSDSALQHLQLSAADFAAAASADEFRRKWSRFLRRGDVLIVYHPNTYRLLQHLDAAQPRCLVLKSIFRQLRADFHSLENLIEIEQVKPAATTGASRAELRLEMAIALVERLRERHKTST